MRLASVDAGQLVSNNEGRIAVRGSTQSLDSEAVRLIEKKEIG